ncbi:MAG: glycoside hydrolase family 30 beta sandwich domain-containing protein [Christensenella sp.]|nr:glycoside hydrolase family 30 beta sandwich domain-containing protein [Christensenella sp.]
MSNVSWYFSNEQAQWQQKTCERADTPPSLAPDGRTYQRMEGFGGCFNELGYRALSHLSAEDRAALFTELYAPDHANFNLCRLPIGANDYAEDWYSLDETPGDFALEKFSIERDKRCLIPYIKEAQTYQPEMKLFASPWSPPTWMKNPPVYNWGKLVWTPENLSAYANYFAKFVLAYAEQGVHIDQIHVQNEPVANQKFPSCMWTGEELRVFIRDYIGPVLKRQCPSTELWLGTINAPGCDYNRLIFDKWATEDYDYFANIVLSDERALAFIAGVSYQWGGKIAIQRTFESWWPRVRLMQSENECGFGDNTWDYALYVWTMMKHYIGNGAESYLYWNPVLEPVGRSTWGDPQNAMVTVDPASKRYTLNPDYYVMKSASAIVQRGAVRLGMTGVWAADTLAFQNPDGSLALSVFNPFCEVRSVTLLHNGETLRFPLEPRSVNSILIR